MQLPALSDHAVIRYMQRVRNVELDEDDKQGIAAARQSLQPLLRCGARKAEPPPWAGRLRGDCQGYFMVGDDVCFLLAHNCAVTCVVRGTIPEATRKRRNNTRKSRRYARARQRGR